MAKTLITAISPEDFSKLIRKLEKQTRMKYHLNNRMKLIKKIGKNKNYEPTKEELRESYGYLDYCLDCGKEIKFGESSSHCFLGNRHKFGCSIQQRIFGWIYHFMIFIFIKLPILIIVAPFYFGWKYIKKNESLI